MQKVIRTNRYGVDLVNCGTFWAISQSNGDGTNRVYHVGEEKYIKRLWNKDFTIIYDICPITGCQMTVFGKEKRDNNILAR